jgi:hypothetical protein
MDVTIAHRAAPDERLLGYDDATLKSINGRIGRWT